MDDERLEDTAQEVEFPPVKEPSPCPLPVPASKPRCACRWWRVAVLCLAVALLVAAAVLFGPSLFRPKPRAILAGMLAAYSGAKTYQADGVMKMHIEMGTMKQDMEVPHKVFYQAPNLLLSDGGQGVSQAKVVCDGANLYLEVDMLKSVLKMPAPKDVSGLSQYMSSSLGGLPGGGAGTPASVLDFGTLVSGGLQPDKATTVTAGFNAKDPWLAGLEQPSGCWVITATFPDSPPATLWVDRRSLLIRQAAATMSGPDLLKAAGPAAGSMAEMFKTMTIKLVMINRAVSVGKPVPANTFTYQPPPGLKVIEGANMGDLIKGMAGGAGGAEPKEVDLAGKTPTDFTAQDLAGKAVKLSSFRGKPLVIDFWATWCGPCRQAMPILDGIYGQLQAQGLQVVAVSSDQDLATVKQYLAENPLKLTVLWLDPKDAQAVDAAYGVVGIPRTVYVGSDWTIKSAATGLHAKADYLKAIAALGVDTSGVPQEGPEPPAVSSTE